MNKRLYYYLPIIFSVIFITGLFFGKLYFTNSTLNDLEKLLLKNTSYNSSSYDKLQQLLYYIENEYVDTINKDSLIEKAMSALLEKLDPHSVYIPAEEFDDLNDPLEGEFEGIGIEFSIQNDTIVVMNTIIGGPSEKVGLLAGDRIVKVNDSTVAGVGITNQKVMKLLKGPKGTRVKVHIKRSFIDKLIEFTITRDKIPMHSIDVAMKISNDIGYIKIARFAKTTPTEFREALEKLHKEGIHKIIVDVRGNGGGYMDAAISVADEFLKENELIVYTEGKAHPRKEYRATSYGIAHNDEVVILQDMFSASASEILAGAIQDNDRGTIIGQRSFGKGLVQEPIFFNDKSSVRLTIARYYTPSGRCIQREYKNSLTDYYTDIITRTDSVDSLSKQAPIFKTKKGRTVYGNGGIYPDIAVKNHQKENDFFYKTASQSVIYQFAFQYSDKNRSTFNKFKHWEELDKYLKQSSIYQDFINYAERQGIKADSNDIQQSKTIIMNHTRSYIIRNIFNNEGFYAISLENDPVIQAALNHLSKK